LPGQGERLITYEKEIARRTVRGRRLRGHGSGNGRHKWLGRLAPQGLRKGGKEEYLEKSGAYLGGWQESCAREDEGALRGESAAKREKTGERRAEPNIATEDQRIQLEIRNN